MKKIIFLLLIIIIPINVFAIGACNATGAYSPYGPAGCIDPGWNSSSTSVDACYEISPNTYDGFEQALLILGSSGDIGQATCDARALLYNANPSAYAMFPFPWLANEAYTSHLYQEAKSALYGGGISQSIKDKYSSGSSNIQDIKFTWESLGNENINDINDNRIYARKIRLTINVIGTVSGDSLSYQVGFDGNNSPFQISYLRGYSSGTIYSNTTIIDMVIYSTQIINDISKVKLKASAKVSNSALALHLCQGYGPAPAQRFLAISNKNLSKSYNSPIYSFDVSKTCQYKIEKDENGKETPKYELHITNPNSDYKEVQEVDALTYMSKGCCNDIEPKFFNVNTKEGKDAIEYYKENCMFKDLVSYENNCASTVEYVYNSETNTGKCVKHEIKKPDESYSFIWQAPIDTIIKTKLNNGNISLKAALNDQKTKIELEDYYVENLSNKYCKVIASEDNDIYFPTTAVASSGRFFVFQQQDCKGSTCFNQPHINGKITLYIENDIDTYKKELNDITNQMNQKNCSNTTDNVTGVDCNNLKKEYDQIISMKNQCEQSIKNFDYNLEPKIIFKYSQDYLDETGNKKTEENTVEMVPSNESIKFWPKKTTDVKASADTSNYQFENNNTYKITYEKTVYYRPKEASFSLLPDGYVKLVEENTQNYETPSLDIGYVYNVRTTAYPGVYSTSFYITNLGYNQSIYKDNFKSNLNNVVDKYITASMDNIGGIYNGEKALVMTNNCNYCNEEGSFYRECPTCEELDAKFIFRNVNLNDIMPNEREDTNWSDEKGEAAKRSIENMEIAKSNPNNENNGNIKLLASGNNTYLKENLEYEITLTPEKIKEIKESNKDYNYQEFNTNTNLEYHYVCNIDMKECESSFVTKYSEIDITTDTRRYKWKYFNSKDSKFENGRIEDLPSIFQDGRYPDPYNQIDYLEEYKNWP